ncbi:lactonase family protein [Streptococcus sp. DD13]|uniref:lactonase family protein n=1 Tax=Streptococcus sp. DD13 TaxID=1777881 RepID=UPI0007942132|nr:lactonase family protein [Streptococcus sp. DD13]KXT79111.1 6-phosphogluconolactonase [Streptococcus sp. DD13]
MLVYFGTYTRRLSQGIYQADFNEKTGELSQPRLLGAEPSPTYLAIAADGFAYSVGAKDEKGGIAAWDPNFHLIQHVVQEGAPHCYVSVDDDRQLVYAANYHKGQVLVYKKEENGRLTLADCVQHSGQGPHENQASSHVHFADLTPDRYLVTCDLGTDHLVTYEISEEGKLTAIDQFQITPGAGPRHLVFHPSQKMAYVVCELNSTVEVLIYDGYGDFESIQILSLIPKDYDGFNGGGAIRISSDGRFLYVSNRGHDSIASFSIGADGLLVPLEIVKTGGHTPRDFTLSPDEHFLIVPHQDSDNVSVLQRDAANGKLTLLSDDCLIPEATSVLFGDA